MTSHDLRVPVMNRFALGYPKHPAVRPTGQDDVVYAPLTTALTTRFDWDAHFAAYSLPDVPRRLASAGAFSLNPAMTLFVVDVEPPGHAEVTDQWWALERTKIAQALADNPGGYAYRTKGGYRVLWQLANFWTLSSRQDAANWSASYLAWLAWLDSKYAIHGDETCADWTRMYRLPLVRRDGSDQHPEVIGDPARVGPWNHARVSAPPAPEHQAYDVPLDPSIPDVDRLERAARALAAVWPETGRHQAQLSLAGALARMGWPVELIADFAATVAELHEPGSALLDKRRKAAEDSVSKALGGDPVRGWSSLWPLLRSSPGSPPGVLDGEDLVQVTCSSLGISAPPRHDQAFVDALMATAASPRDLLAAQIDEIEIPAQEATPQPQVTVPPEAMLLQDVALLDHPPIRVYPTGFGVLDELLGGGIATRQLSVICAPPADGKSAWAVELALRIEPLIPVLYVSTELERDEVMARAGAHLLDKFWRDAVRGRVGKTDLAAALNGKRIWTIGSSELSRDSSEALMLVTNTVIAMTARYGVPPLVIVDYLQDLARGGDERGLRARVGDIATTLRVMAQRLDCALWAVSSVSRTYYGAQKQASLRESNDPRVYLAAMKESGDVDYAAATAIFIDADTAPEGTDVRPVRFAIAKNRHGECGFVGARFRGATGRWTADQSALEDVTSGKAAASRLAKQEEGDDEIVFDKLVELAGMNKRPSKTELREMFPRSLGDKGIGKPRAEEAIDRLVAAGRVRKGPGHFTNRYGSTTPREVLIVDVDPAPLPEPDPPDPAIAKMVALVGRENRTRPVVG